MSMRPLSLLILALLLLPSCVPQSSGNSASGQTVRRAVEKENVIERDSETEKQQDPALSDYPTTAGDPSLQSMAASRSDETVPERSPHPENGSYRENSFPEEERAPSIWTDPEQRQRQAEESHNALRKLQDTLARQSGQEAPFTEQTVPQHQAKERQSAPVERQRQTVTASQQQTASAAQQKPDATAQQRAAAVAQQKQIAAQQQKQQEQRQRQQQELRQGAVADQQRSPAPAGQQQAPVSTEQRHTAATAGQQTQPFTSAGDRSSVQSSPPAASIDNTAQQRADTASQNFAPPSPQPPRRSRTTPPSAPLSPTQAGDAVSTASPSSSKVTGSVYTGVISSAPVAPSGSSALPSPTEAPRPPVTPPSRTANNVPSTGGAQASYDAALSLYHKGQFGQAQEAFTSFLRSYPTGNLTADALYWQGECLYSQRKFEQAIFAFKDVAGKYPSNRRAADSLLKAGYAYAELNDTGNARFYWQLLVDDYPTSTAAALARKRLENK